MQPAVCMLLFSPCDTHILNELLKSCKQLDSICYNTALFEKDLFEKEYIIKLKLRYT